MYLDGHWVMSCAAPAGGTKGGVIRDISTRYSMNLSTTWIVCDDRTLDSTKSLEPYSPQYHIIHMSSRFTLLAYYIFSQNTNEKVPRGVTEVESCTPAESCNLHSVEAISISYS